MREPPIPMPQSNDRSAPAPASDRVYSCQVLPAEAVVVSSGANLGDPIAPPDEICLGDVYQLAPQAQAMRLSILTLVGREGETHHSIATGSEIGPAGAALGICGRLTLMAPDGDAVEILLLRLGETDGRGPLLVLPLSPMAAKTDYTLIQAETEPGAVRLTDLVCSAFSRGTNIALADGRQVPIETLQPGDRVLTRDHGPQPLRWVGRATLRALGSFAPVVITAGALGNSGDLVVGQHHRLFLYQHSQDRLVHTAELLVQAKHLVDGERVFLRQGGYVDYFSLIFDNHEIVYAEGIPAESLMVNEATLSLLPDTLAEQVKARFPGLSQRQHFGTEAARAAVDRLGAAGLLRQSRAG